MSEVRDNYDAVVIGAGMGGLTCGAFLAKSGLSVLVADKNTKPGGACVSYQHDGYSFDNGLGYLFGCEPGGIIHETLEELGLRRGIEFVKMQPALTVVGSGYRLPISSPESLGQLTEEFPGEAAAISRFADECKAVAVQGDAFTCQSVDLMGGWQRLGFFSTFLLKYPGLTKYARKSWREVVGTFFRNESLRAIISSTFSYAGLDATPILMMSFLGRVDKINYPKGGFQALANLLSDGIVGFGGDLALGTPVNRIIVDGDRAVGVEIGNGRRVKARHIISNVDARQTFYRLVGEEHFSAGFKKGLNASKPSIPGFVVSLGVDVDLEENGFGNGYIVYNPSDSMVELFGPDPERCTVSIAMPSISDHSRAPKGATAVELTATLPYDLVRDWKSEENAIADKLIAAASKVIPDLPKHIVYRHVTSPLTFEQTRLISGGAMLGWQVTAGIPRSQRTPIKNLYQAGHWTSPGPGVNLVTASGRNAARLVIKAH